jgi:hypothetical protein
LFFELFQRAPLDQANVSHQPGVLARWNAVHVDHGFNGRVNQTQANTGFTALPLRAAKAEQIQGAPIFWPDFQPFAAGLSEPVFAQSGLQVLGFEVWILILSRPLFYPVAPGFREFFWRTASSTCLP